MLSMRREWMGAGQWVVPWAALLACGCQPSPPPREAAHGLEPLSSNLKEIQVFDLATGRAVSAWRVVREDEGVFFTCLCAPCESVARALAENSKKVALVSYKSRAEVANFAKATSWQGPVYLDPGSKMAVACRVFECPKFVQAMGDHSVSELTLSDALRRWGGARE